MAHDWSEQPVPARLERVVDGDTYDVVLDLGYHVRHEVRLRLAGVDTAEVYGVAHDSQEYEDGQEQSEFVQAWMREASYGWDGEWPLLVNTVEYDKYGRKVAEVRRQCDGEALAEALLERWPGTESN